VLEWEDRYKIAVGICKALVYLHDGSPRPVIHMNVKPSNILLSHDLHPQVLLHFITKTKNGAEFSCTVCDLAQELLIIRSLKMMAMMNALLSHGF